MFRSAGRVWMNQRLTQRLAKAVEAIRVWLPTAPQQFRQFIEEAREDPRALTKSPAFRVGVILCGGLVVALILHGVGQWIAPSADMGSPAELVPVTVRCVSPSCKRLKERVTIMVERDFDDWPAECPRCKQKTLYPLVRCHNSKCRQWVTPKIKEDGSWWCPKCGSRL